MTNALRIEIIFDDTGCAIYAYRGEKLQTLGVGLVSELGLGQDKLRRAALKSLSRNLRAL